MAKTNGIFVSDLPKHTRIDDLWKVLNYDENCKIDYILFPLDQHKSKAYIHFSEYPGSFNVIN